jgi:hypothetical protein
MLKRAYADGRIITYEIWAFPEQNMDISGPQKGDITFLDHREFTPLHKT